MGCTFEYVCMHKCVCVRMYTYMYIRMYRYVFVYVCTYVCVFIIHMYVCVFMRVPGPRGASVYCILCMMHIRIVR